MNTEEHQKMLARRADVVRSRLLRTIDALDARRHHVTEVGVVAKKMAVPAAAALVGGLALAAGITLAVKAVVKSRRNRSLGKRAERMLDKVTASIARQARPSFAQELGKKLAMTAITFLVTEVGRRAVKNVVDGRLPDGRLAAHDALAAHHTMLSAE